MRFRYRVWPSIPLLALLFCVPGEVRAGETTAGITLNGTTGHHIESGGAQVVPFVPAPMFQIQHKHKNFTIRAEIMPPIGPVSLIEGDGFAPTQSPRVSFLTADALYTLKNGRLALGIGESILNQTTYYSGPSIVQSSRVVGARYTVQSLLYFTPFGRLDAAVSVNPSMHGVQSTVLPAGYLYGPSGPWPALKLTDGEIGSMVDSALRWSVPYRRYTFSYGLRYVNYTAQYSASGRLADHNHLLMPFIGINVRLNRAPLHEEPGTYSNGNTPVLIAPYRPGRGETRIGMSLYGTSGSHDGTFSSPSVTPFGMAPALELTHRGGRIEAHVNGILPMSRANPFGSEQITWSYLDAGLRYITRNNRYAFGVSDTSINQNVTHTPTNSFNRSHHEGLRYSLSVIPFSSMRERFEIALGLVPYLHDSTYSTFMEPAPGTTWCPACPPPVFVSRTFTRTRPGSLVDLSVKWTLTHRQYEFSYGVRYMNQTINVASWILAPGETGPNAVLQHDTAFMPFVGLTARLGRKP